MMSKSGVTGKPLGTAAFIKESEKGVKKVYLFGSYAKGAFDEDSDIDVAIVFDALANTFDMQVELMKLRRKFDTRIEPHPFREEDFNTPIYFC